MKTSTRTNAMRDILCELAIMAEARGRETLGFGVPARHAAWRTLAAEFRARAAGHKSRPHPRHRRSDHG